MTAFQFTITHDQIPNTCMWVSEEINETRRRCHHYLRCSQGVGVAPLKKYLSFRELAFTLINLQQSFISLYGLRL